MAPGVRRYTEQQILDVDPRRFVTGAVHSVCDRLEPSTVRGEPAQHLVTIAGVALLQLVDGFPKHVAAHQAFSALHGEYEPEGVDLCRLAGAGEAQGRLAPSDVALVDAAESETINPSMTDDTQPDLEIITRPRGGAGRGAEWEWGVYAAGNVVPLASGRTMGAERKAKAAGQAAMRELLEARRKKPK